MTTGLDRCKASPIPQALQDIVHAGGVENVLRSEGYLAPRRATRREIDVTANRTHR